MKMMGLKMSVYWTVTYMLFFAEYTIISVVFWIFGAASGINFFTIHSPFILFLYLFLWGNVLIAFSMLLTVFFSKTRSAVAVGFILIFAFVIGGYMVFETLQSDPSTPEAAYYAWQWLPPMAFMRATVYIVNASSRVFAITMQNWHETPLPGIFGWLFVEWATCLGLTFYLEKVLPVGYGVRAHPCFCVRNHLGGGRSGNGTATRRRRSGSAIQMQQPLLSPDSNGVGAAVSPGNSPYLSSDEISGQDVRDEAMRVQYGGSPRDVESKVMSGADPDSLYRVRVLGLRKEFEGRGGADKKVAVDGLFLGIRPNECLGLLGPNGAGKTTAISMLCGLFEPTSGGARVDGWRIRDPSELHKIHQTMGVCPQHDVLWGDLTGREHLLFYGRLKGLSGRRLEDEVTSTLEDVKLTFAADKASGQYSGGMKRRLSVANALVGSPRVVYLDEPSTGLDPSARRTLWDCIVAAKGKNKSIVLTTHSMEEADALCDRLAIMARGKLRCIGKAAELKKRFGAGFTFTVSVAVPGAAAAAAAALVATEAKSAAAAAQRSVSADSRMSSTTERDNQELQVRQTKVDLFVREKLFPSATLLSEPIAGTAQYEVSKEDVDLAVVFQTLEDEATRSALFISDWAITETTLDECFLKVTRRVHAEEDGTAQRQLGRTLSVACREDTRAAASKAAALQ
jgi:ABC-type multidrug transport system ATPase subunit